ncbi:alpha-L-arabinofuranosidase [Puia dinghuensis]|uniref:non-reducing end alpha-L-arabinofuranosidase n=1 Tax=Puia dinghuensis TaxID=1792502 RepID=A0A8J2XSZ8_9BACT|nr:alpha-L-arabinofuranosidase [Puia dinghuensis]
MFFGVFLFFFASPLFLQTAVAQEITVEADKPGAAIRPTMWGIFFEDINMAADGGLYAELVKNRSFEFNNPLMGWTEHSSVPGNGNILVLNRGAENPDNPRFIRVTHYTDGEYGLSNEGFRGMGIKQGETYHFSIWDRPAAPVALRLELQNPNGQPIGSARLLLNPSTDWKRDTISFTATVTEAKARLYIGFEGQGVVDLDMISLFPQHTWKQRPGGLRADLVQLLADMHPGFIRFPGGCIVEGRDLTNRYQWKKTVGRVEDRKLIMNRWNVEFAHRSTPDYFQSFGLGFFEYFQLAEDIGAEPLPILNCGMACQFNTAEVVPIPDIDPYIQDALDLIEFANGDTSTKWGGLRAAMGHPAPFHLKMMGVGNEQWGPQYVERYKVFTRAIKARYPDIRLVNSTGPDPNGEKFDFLNDTLRKLHADILDEHYYRNPGWFLQNATRYDHYDRNGPKIFAGEYAAQSDKVVSVNNRSNWQCALAEAAFMTGLERNADIVQMASYAPLFAHVDGWQWTPDLIWFDNLRSYGTADYYVQKLFANNKGTAVLPLTRQGSPLTGQDGLYGSACIDSAAREIVIKLVNTTAQPQSLNIRLDGVRKVSSPARAFLLSAARLDAVNTLDNPTAISPVGTSIPSQGKKLASTLAPYTFSVIRIKI